MYWMDESAQNAVFRCAIPHESPGRELITDGGIEYFLNWVSMNVGDGGGGGGGASAGPEVSGKSSVPQTAPGRLLVQVSPFPLPDEPFFPLPERLPESDLELLGPELLPGLLPGLVRETPQLTFPLSLHLHLSGEA